MALLGHTGKRLLTCLCIASTMDSEDSMTTVWQLAPLRLRRETWHFSFGSEEVQLRSSFRFHTPYLFHCSGVIFQGTGTAIFLVQSSHVLVDLFLDDFRIFVMVSIPIRFIPFAPSIPMAYLEDFPSQDTVDDWIIPGKKEIF